MSSLADRLAAASRDRANTPMTQELMAPKAERPNGAEPKGKTEDPFTDLKSKVHHRLLQQLGELFVGLQRRPPD